MRSLIMLAGLGCMLGAELARAADTPHPSELINKSIKSLRGTSYVATMRFISSLDGGEERTIEIRHIAPDLYRVQPLDSGRKTDEFYVENAEELVRVYRGNVMTMPARQFAVNDALTVKFLRDLSQTTDTIVLDGMVGERKAFVLRRDPVRGRDYTVTVGVDKHNHFPLYLLVTDSRGARKVYYQMEQIDFVSDKEMGRLLPDSDFDLAKYDEQERAQKPRSPGSATKSTALGAASGGGAGFAPSAATPLPLFPSWLPRGYNVEAIYSLGCELRQRDKGEAEARIYHLEAYGPSGELLSIFQTTALDAKDSLDKLRPQDLGFVAVEQSGWTIAIFSDLERDVLMRVAGSLSADQDRVRELLAETRLRDSIIEQAAN